MKNMLFLKPGGGRTLYSGPALAFDLLFYLLPLLQKRTMERCQFCYTAIVDKNRNRMV